MALRICSCPHHRWKADFATGKGQCGEAVDKAKAIAATNSAGPLQLGVGAVPNSYTAASSFTVLRIASKLRSASLFEKAQKNAHHRSLSSPIRARLHGLRVGFAAALDFYIDDIVTHRLLRSRRDNVRATVWGSRTSSPW